MRERQPPQTCERRRFRLVGSGASHPRPGYSTGISLKAWVISTPCERRIAFITK